MAFVYKSDQGYWTRMMTAVAGGTLALAGGGWVYNQLQSMKLPFERIYLQGAVFGVMAVVSALLIYWIVYKKPSTSEFLIATEGEMKKVNWSTRREIVGSTWVVIAISVIIAALLFVVDLAFHEFFQRIGVIKF